MQPSKTLRRLDGLRNTQILLNHLTANRVVEFTVLLKGLERQLPIDLVEATEKRADELHATNLTQKISHALVGTGVLGPHSNVVVGGLELGILGVREAIGLAECLLWPC